MKNFLIAIITLSAILLHAQSYISPNVYTEPMIIHFTNSLQASTVQGAKNDHIPRRLASTSSTLPKQLLVNPVHTPTGGKTLAVIIGIGRYQTLSELKYADDDARRMYRLIRDQKSTFQGQNDIRLLLNEQATRFNILNTLQEILLTATPEDQVLVYYSGHGLPGAFTPTDYFRGKNTIPHEKLANLLDRCRAKFKLCIVDACHSGGMRAQELSGEDITNRYYRAFSDSPAGTVLLLSSQAREYSFESDDLRQGVFSHFLLRGLYGEADYNEDRVISISELYTFTYQEVSAYTKFMQFPVLSGLYDQDMAVRIQL